MAIELTTTDAVTKQGIVDALTTGGSVTVDSVIIGGADAGEIATNKATTRTNLGLGTTDSPTFAGVTVDTDTLYVDSVNHRVGIGKTNPGVSLDVSGRIDALYIYSDVWLYCRDYNTGSNSGIYKGGASGDVGLSRTAVSTYAIGNGTAGDKSGTLELANLTASATLTVGSNTWNGSTISGAQAFSSTTRPTSAGTGTPEADSLITMADGDARFGYVQMAVLESDTSITNSTTVTAVGPTLTLDAGTYQIETLLAFYNASAAPGGKGGFIASQAITFMGRVELAPNGAAISSTTWGNDSITEIASSCVFAGQYGVCRQIGVIVIPSSTTIRLAIAQNTSSGDATIAKQNSFLKVTKIA